MFVGFGPYLKTIQMVINIIGLVIFMAIGAIVTRGNHVPTPLDIGVLLVVILIAFQTARTPRKGAQFGTTDVVVCGHVFERVIALENVTAVVIPNPPGVLKVIAADGGYASTQISANLLEMPADRTARRTALARLAAALGPRGVYVGEVTVPWASGLNKITPMVVKRAMPFTRSDGAWLGASVAAWLALSLL